MNSLRDEQHVVSAVCTSSQNNPDAEHNIELAHSYCESDVDSSSEQNNLSELENIRPATHVDHHNQIDRSATGQQHQKRLVQSLLGNVSNAVVFDSREIKLRDLSLSSMALDIDQVDGDDELESIARNASVEKLLASSSWTNMDVSDNTRSTSETNITFPLFNISALGNTQSEQQLMQSILSAPDETAPQTPTQICQNFFEQLVDFDLRLTQLTIDVFEHRIPNAELDDPDISPVDSLNAAFVALQNEVEEQTASIKEAGQWDEINNYLDTLEVRLKRIDTLRKDSATEAESLEWDEDVAISKTPSPAREIQTSSTASINADVGCQTTQTPPKSPPSPPNVNHEADDEREDDDEVSDLRQASKIGNGANKEIYDDVASGRNSCSSGYESRQTKVDTDVTKVSPGTRAEIIDSNIMKEVRKRSVRNRKKPTVAKGEVRSEPVGGSAVLSTDPDPAKYKDISDDLRNKAEGLHWRRICCILMLVAITLIILGLCLLPIEMEVTRESSFTQSSFFTTHQEWFTVSYPNGPPPV